MTSKKPRKPQARLSEREWAEIQNTWENDPREKFAWLIPELDLGVTLATILYRAKTKKWTKKLLAIECENSDSAKADPVKKIVQPTIKPLKDEVFELEDFLGLDLTPKEKVFVFEYVRDFNHIRAASVAGYVNPSSNAQRVLRSPNVSQAIENYISKRAVRCGIDGDNLIKLWISIVTFDANELASYRRYCCPFCYSTNGEPQETLEDYYNDKNNWEDREREKAANNFPDYIIQPFRPMREVWDQSKEPVPECPNCHGLGKGEVVLKDTTKLSPLGKLMYAGAAENKKGGAEIAMLSKQAALESLARALGLYKEKEKVTEINIINDTDLSNRYEEVLAKARERQTRVFLERDIQPDPDIIDYPENENGNK